MLDLENILLTKNTKMKKFILLLIAFSTFAIQAQRKPKIKGNKSVVNITESLPAFNTIELNDGLSINLQKASEEGYKLTIDDNLIDVLKFKVEDGTLFISSFYKITRKKKLEITVNYRELSAVILRDGKIEMKDVIETDELTIETYGSSKLELNANTNLTHLTMEGNSSGNLNLESDSLNITLKDRIDARIYSTSEKNTIKMNSNASVIMEGTVYALSATLSDKANLKARKLEAEGVEIIAEGSPTARVYATSDFELTSKGSSKTYLSGTAEIDIIEFLDTSELHKEK